MLSQGPAGAVGGVTGGGGDIGVVAAGSYPEERGAVGSSGLGSLAVGSVLMNTTLLAPVARGRLSP